MTILEQLYTLRDEQYARFQAKLIPSVHADSIVGVRLPQLRKLARSLKGGEEARSFLDHLPHSLYDENILHVLLLSAMDDYHACIRAVDAFLPFVDNWAVCDTLSPQIFKRHKSQLLLKIPLWVASPHSYTCRFGIKMLMTHFLDTDFRPELLEIPVAVRSHEYYVNMMVAWFFATALAKQWDASLPYIEQHRLDTDTHNKTIQKACESFRIPHTRKAYLKTLKKN